MGAQGCKPCCANDAKVLEVMAEPPRAADNMEDPSAAAAAVSESYDPAKHTDALDGGNVGNADPGPSHHDSSAPGLMSVKIVRDKDLNIGLNLDGLDGATAFVDNIIPGSVQAWNDTHDARERLEVHDRIVSVNGVTGETDRILAELKAQYIWTLVILRPKELSVAVDCKRFPSLGLDLKYSPNGNTLLIAGLGDGPITEYNSTASKDKLVRTNDRIVAINGTRGGARNLLDSAARAETLELTVLHYDP